MAKRKTKPQVQKENQMNDLTALIEAGNPDVVDVMGSRPSVTYENLPEESGEAEYVYSVPETLSVLQGTAGLNSVRFSVPRGTKLRVLSQKEESDGVIWLRVDSVDTPGRTGWVVAAGNTEPE